MHVQAGLGPDSPIVNMMLSNPDLLRTIMQSNPAIQRLVEGNPQMAEVLNNPEVLRDAMRVMSNPVRASAATQLLLSTLALE